MSENNFWIRKVTLVVLALLTTVANAELLLGRVVGVSDGDTITVLDADRQQHKVRLAGIDAPEKAQAFGQRSKQHLSDLVFNQDVEVAWAKRDRYKRIVGKVLAANPECRQTTCPKTFDACLAQITSGMAWWYEKYANDQSKDDADRYHQAEQDARQSRTGLWAESVPMPPWEWRKATH